MLNHQEQCPDISPLCGQLDKLWSQKSNVALLLVSGGSGGFCRASSMELFIIIYVLFLTNVKYQF